MAQYDLDLSISKRFREYTVKFVLDPIQWGSLVLPCALNWNIVRFIRASVALIPDDQVGVYTFVIKPDIANHANCGYLMYVGPRAIFILTKQVLPDMIKRRSGAIVNISSSGAIGPGRGPYKGREPSAYSGTKYGAEKAAIERFSQGLAEEVYQYGISVTALSPSQLVVTPGTLYFKMAAGPNDPRAEPPEMMAKAALLLATERLDKITGRVTYSQAILKEFGWITEAKGVGVDRPGTGYSQI